MVDEAAHIGAGLDPVVGTLAAVEGEPVAGADPGDVELADLHAGRGLVDDRVQTVLRPQAHGHVRLREPGAGLGEILVAATVSVVHQHPAVRHAVVYVALRDVQRVEGVPLTAIGVVQVAVGVPEFQTVDRWQERFADQIGVAADHRLEVADEVVGVETLLLLGGGDGARGGGAEVVAARGEGVAEDAVARGET